MKPKLSFSSISSSVWCILQMCRKTLWPTCTFLQPVRQMESPAATTSRALFRSFQVFASGSLYYRCIKPCRFPADQIAGAHGMDGAHQHFCVNGATTLVFYWCKSVTAVRPITTYEPHTHTPATSWAACEQAAASRPHHKVNTTSRKQNNRTPSRWGKWVVLPEDDPQTIIIGNSNAKCVLGRR